MELHPTALEVLRVLIDAGLHEDVELIGKGTVYIPLSNRAIADRRPGGLSVTSLKQVREHLFTLERHGLVKRVERQGPSVESRKTKDGRGKVAEVEVYYIPTRLGVKALAEYDAR